MFTVHLFYLDHIQKIENFSLFSFSLCFFHFNSLFFSSLIYCLVHILYKTTTKNRILHFYFYLIFICFNNNKKREKKKIGHKNKEISFYDDDDESMRNA